MFKLPTAQATAFAIVFSTMAGTEGNTLQNEYGEPEPMLAPPGTNFECRPEPGVSSEY